MTPTDRDRLRRALADAAARIGRYRGTSFNEQDTKAVLIEPVLEALGWDTRDPEHVRREYKFHPHDNPVDYALHLARVPKLMVEAKGLNESMDDRRWVGQTIGYAAVGGAVWCVLTNGDEYRIYNAAAAVQAADKLLCRVVLSADPPDAVAEVLSLISRPNLGDDLIEVLWKARHVDGRVRAVLTGLLGGPAGGPDPKLVRLIRASEPSLTARDVADSLRRLAVRVEQPPIQVPARGTKAAPPKPPPVAVAKKSKKRPTPRQHTTRLTDLIAAGVLTPPVRLFRRYRKTVLEATVLADGRVEFAGTPHPTPSAAASAARATLTGRPMATNGWDFWQVDVAGKPQTLEAVRAAYSSRSGG